MKIKVSNNGIYAQATHSYEILFPNISQGARIPIGKSGMTLNKRNRNYFQSELENNLSLDKIQSHQFEGNFSKYIPGVNDLDLSKAFVSYNTEVPSLYELKLIELKTPTISAFETSVKKEDPEIPVLPEESTGTKLTDLGIYHSNNSSSTSGSTVMNTPAELRAAVNAHLNIPYVWGGKSKSTGLDCSGFTAAVMRAYGKNVNGTADNMFRSTTRINNQDLKPGDLIFLQDTNPSKRKHGQASHVAVVTDTSGIQNGKIRIAQATGRSKNSSESEIDLNSGYYADHWLGAGRVARLGMKFQPGGKFTKQTESIPGVTNLDLSKMWVDTLLVPSDYEAKRDATYVAPIIPEAHTTTKKKPNDTETKQEVEKMKKLYNIPETPVIPTTLSDNVFKLLLKLEGKTNLLATVNNQFGELFATGPYGMAYKHIDPDTLAPLEKIIPFKAGEQVSEDYALANAKEYYNKRAREWQELLKDKGGALQHELDALVSASGGTKKSTDALKQFVLANWDDKEKIANYLRTFATTASGNGRKLPGLVIRRNWESDLFLNKAEEYEKYYQRRHDFGV